MPKKYANKVGMMHESKGQHIGKAPSAGPTFFPPVFFSISINNLCFRAMDTTVANKS